MPLIVEDGTGVANANSYGDLVGARAYASVRGITLSADDAVLSAQMINAMDYLNGLSFTGATLTDTQVLSWPRRCVYYSSGAVYPTNVVPVGIVSAQYQLVIEQFNGIGLQPSTDWKADGGFVVEDKTDVLMTKWSESVGVGQMPTMPKVDSLLAPFLVGGGNRLRCVRI